MQELYFLARHTPFWAVPLLIIGAEFSLVFWRKKKRLSSCLFASLAFWCLLCVGFYIWAGGPEKTVKKIKRFYIENSYKS